jgi:arylsulfatase A-like enzyme
MIFREARGGKVRLLAGLFAIIAGLGCPGPQDDTGPRPNIILYVIDGAAADRMSLYGYGRRTTPYLERLAAEGVIFENAYSNSSFTKASVPSFMTSLHSSVLGGTRSANDPLPPQAVTMAERMRRAGYATEVLASNPYCGRISGLDRGVDVIDETNPMRPRPSSADLNRRFWRLREADPREPYWVHFQTTDVHRPWTVGDRFSMFRSAAVDIPGFEDLLDRPPDGPTGARVFRIAADLYDACMAFQDRSLGRLVERLKKSGAWERTLLVVTADHAHVAAGLPFFDPQAPRWNAPVLASHKSRVPLIFVWPGRIAPGRRLTQRVSLIDLLPTILDLVGLAPPEVAQGRSLAPLLLGRRGWKPRPVVLDEFWTDGKDLWGSLETIDGRWGASLRIDTRPEDKWPLRDRLRPAPLLLFDIEADPHALKSLHEERPDLVRRYAKLLGCLWGSHLNLAKRFTRAGRVPMTPAEIEALRSLGYIR